MVSTGNLKTRLLHLDRPSCLSKGSHETLGRTESNTLGRELSTGFWREDVVYILDPVFILDEVLPLLPGGSSCVISVSSRLGLREAASCSLHVKMDSRELERERLPKVIFHEATVSTRTKVDPSW